MAKCFPKPTATGKTYRRDFPSPESPEEKKLFPKNQLLELSEKEDRFDPCFFAVFLGGDLPHQVTPEIPGENSWGFRVSTI